MPYMSMGPWVPMSEEVRHALYVYGAVGAYERGGVWDV